MRRIVALFLLATSLCVAAASPDLPEKWRSWRYSRAVTANPATADSPSTIELPWELYAHCRSWCVDVRLLNSQGAEVPYEIMEILASGSTGRAARVIENSFVSGQYTQVIGDLGAGREESFDRVRVDTTEPNFIVWAEVALSDDAKTWRVVEPRAPIARFRSSPGAEGTMTIPIQGLSSRYIRVRIADPSKKFPVDGLLVSREQSHSLPPKEVPASFAMQNSSDATVSVWQTTLSSSNLVTSEIHLSTSAPEFYRAMRISASGDGQEWSYIGSGVVYRYKHDEKIRESLVVDGNRSDGWRFVRVELVNGNDKPLENVALKIFAAPMYLRFKPTTGQSYRLIYGNEKATRPQYDLAHYLDFEPSKPAYFMSLGPEEATANYRDPRPFTERHPEVLWTALGVAIVLIGLTAIRTLRTPAKSADQS